MVGEVKIGVYGYDRKNESILFWFGGCEEVVEEGGSRAHCVSELCHLFPSLLYAWWFGGW